MNPFKIYTKDVRFTFFRKKEESHLNGEITFLDNRIIVNDKIFSIDALSGIKFSCFDDYVGKIDTVNGKISKGVNNSIGIYSKNGEKNIYYFQLDHRYQIRDIREQLIQYHLSGKLDFMHLIAILGMEDYNAIENFKKTLASYGK
ncbi:hypothetical protein [Flavobacterium sp. NRK1]|uniref:hypothetical protein n=1 Tax=Flavobacterium sp. NRK1 TaxID=2954929 RepID=UPI0020931832|nr:hypothetical protein [Flavobacterium sp. NRK1]MCO6146766.1 hypothetical protein [Flavobacterium sp. NRK1]